MASSFFKQKRLSWKTYTFLVRGSNVYSRLSDIKVSENTIDKNLSNFGKLRYKNNRNLKIYDFLQKLKKLVRIVLYGRAISQSDCRKAGPYQLLYNNYFDAGLTQGCV